jgi:hypothetical protein
LSYSNDAVVRPELAVAPPKNATKEGKGGNNGSRTCSRSSSGDYTASDAEMTRYNGRSSDISSSSERTLTRTAVESLGLLT